MKFETDDDAIAYVKANAKETPKWVSSAREYCKELCALVEGENFKEELISKIESIESENKAKARQKYSRDVRDFFSRINLPTQNVFSATGGVKNYQNGETQLSEENLKRLFSTIGNIRDGKSIERFIETKWMPLYHTDPSGVLFMRYAVDKVNDKVSVYPTYQCINVIRVYIPSGQCVQNILFEPTDKEGGIKVWILVDDAKQYTINQKGDVFTLDTDELKTFEHPFGTCPIIINSDITDKYGNRKSPFDVIIPAAKEYARDLSIKTIYKFLQGFPKHWRREMICASCHGTRKSGNGDDACKDCSPKGNTGKADVTDVAILPFNPELENTIKGDDVMGFVSPDLKTWEQMNTELDRAEDSMYETLWGTAPVKKIQKTATEIHYDMQPQINKLNKYADVAEWIEWKMVEWCANIIDPAKAKDESISLIVYGRRYILEGVDTIQEKYENAKKAGENTIVLDGIFDELLTVKFKNDPEWMKIELKKSQCEPYLHYSALEIFTYFGAKESARKIYFQAWWKNLLDSDLQKDVKVLQQKFITDFEVYLPTLKLEVPPPATPPQS